MNILIYSPITADATLAEVAAASPEATAILRYRGVAHGKTNTRARAKASAHQLVYRGVEHDGSAPVEPSTVQPGQRRYRGVAY